MDSEQVIEWNFSRIHKMIGELQDRILALEKQNEELRLLLKPATNVVGSYEGRGKHLVGIE